MPWRVQLSPPAARALDGLPLDAARRLSQLLESLADDPSPPGSRTLRAAPNTHRLRAGAYRVVYALRPEERVVQVLAVGHPRDVIDVLRRRI